MTSPLPLPSIARRARQWLRERTAIQRRRVAERGITLGDNVNVTTYDVSELRARYDGWEAWPRETQRRYIEAKASVRASGSTHNVTCTGWHEQLAALANPQNDFAAVEDPPSTVAFGNDASSFAVSDTALNNKIGEVPLTDPSNRGDVWSMSEQVASTELNDNTLREMGIVSESGTLYNHAALPSPIPKDSDLALIIEATVPFGDQSEI